MVACAGPVTAACSAPATRTCQCGSDGTGAARSAAALGPANGSNSTSWAT